MKTFIFTLPLLAVLTALFILCNHIPRIPWEICGCLWYAYIPLCSAAIAFVYGLTAKKKSGGGTVLSVLFFAVPLYLSAKHALPFASTFTHPLTLLAAVVCTVSGEILGRRLKAHHNQKQSQQKCKRNTPESD